MPRHVPAVNGRNIFGIKRPEIARAVPIVKVAAKSLHLSHRLERCFPTFYSIACADPSEVACGKRGEKIQADIRRRGTVGHYAFRILLKIVWRKKVIGC